MSCIYYDPDKFGLKVVAEVDFLGGYEFDKIVVWRETRTGRLLFAMDSGCSCPTPFGDMGIGDLREVGFDLIEARCDEEKRSEYRTPDLEDIRQFLEKCRAAMAVQP